MSCFDSVYAECGNCSNIVEFQTKSGDCELQKFTNDSVPPDIGIALHLEEEKCHSCGAILTLLLEEPVRRVRMSVCTDFPEDDF